MALNLKRMVNAIFFYLPIYYSDYCGFRQNFFFYQQIRDGTKIAAALPLANCQSQNEFAEKAPHSYCDSLAAADCISVLPPVYLSALKAAIQSAEDHICRLLFKLAVELDIIMNVLAAGMEISEDALHDLWGYCVQDVKKTWHRHAGHGGGVPEGRRVTDQESGSPI